MEDDERKAYRKVIEILASGKEIDYRRICIEIGKDFPLIFVTKAEKALQTSEDSSSSASDREALSLCCFNRHVEAVALIRRERGLSISDATNYITGLLDRANKLKTPSKPVMESDDLERLIHDLNGTWPKKAKASTPTTAGDQVW